MKKLSPGVWTALLLLLGILLWELAAAGESLERLVPPAVAEYIVEQGIYRRSGGL